MAEVKPCPFCGAEEDALECDETGVFCECLSNWKEYNEWQDRPIEDRLEEKVIVLRQKLKECATELNSIGERWNKVNNHFEDNPWDAQTVFECMKALKDTE